MRCCVIGGGIAGVLLSWRLAEHAEVELWTGPADPVDATRVSGGAVRGWEPDPAQRWLAIDSLCELYADDRLREWSRYTETGFLVAVEDLLTLEDAATQIDRSVPGSAQLLPARALARDGWAGLPWAGGALFERRAGFIDPHALRRAVLGDLRRRATVTIRHATAPVHASSTGADLTVVAAGAWTPSVLAAMGVRAARRTSGGLRTKLVEYAVHPAGEWRPLPFIDTLTGLYGRPTPEGLLLGLPTDEWDVPPGARPSGASDRPARLAADRFPRLVLGRSVRRVALPDCYADDGLLRLRPVDGSLFTFTGGSGGAAKTALAATRIATDELVGPLVPTAPPIPAFARI